MVTLAVDHRLFYFHCDSCCSEPDLAFRLTYEQFMSFLDDETAEQFAADLFSEYNTGGIIHADGCWNCRLEEFDIYRVRLLYSSQ